MCMHICYMNVHLVIYKGRHESVCACLYVYMSVGILYYMYTCRQT